MHSDKVCLRCYLHYVSSDLLVLWSLWKNLAEKQSYSRRTHPKQKLLPHHKDKSKYIWLNYYFSAERVMGLWRTRLLIWWWGGLAVWATLSAELLTVFWSPSEPLLKMEHVVKENTTGSLRFELEKGMKFLNNDLKLFSSSRPRETKNALKAPPTLSVSDSFFFFELKCRVRGNFTPRLPAPPRCDEKKRGLWP